MHFHELGFFWRARVSDRRSSNMPRKGQLYDDYDYYDDYEEDYDEYGDSQSNREEASASSAAGQSRQEPTSNSGTWACPICTYENELELKACDICGVLRNSSPAFTASHAARDGYRASEPSQLARSLFAPLPPMKLKKGKIPVQQARDSLMPGLEVVCSTSEIVPFKFDEPSPDDKILGVKQIAKKLPEANLPTPAKSNAADQKPKSKAAPAASESETSKSKAKFVFSENGEVDKQNAAYNDSQLTDYLRTSLTLDSNDGRKATSHKYKGLPLESYKPESWMLQGLKEKEKSLLHLVVVGHVDAGKSTLMGRILHILGRISQKEMHKNQKEANEMGKGSFAYAWALDEGSEERARGVTITVAVAHFETPKLNVVLLDAPGHKDFVPNMISGASQADAAILVVDASTGGFEAGMGGDGQESGQTREHAQLVRSLGVNQLVIAVNKMDAVEYSKDRFEEIRGILAPFLRQCGFRDSAMSWVPVSAIDGQNLVTNPTEDLLKSWYEGPTLLHALDEFEPPQRDISKPFRLAVAEVVRTRTLGATGVGGKIEAGAIKVGSKVRVMPYGEIGTVKSIEHDGKARPVARAGDSVDIGLQGVDAALLMPGGVLCHPDYTVPVATRLELRILTLKILIPILRGAQVVIHAHHAKEPATIADLTALLDAKNGQPVKRSPRCLTSNQSALIEVVPERGVCVEEYSKFRALGRIILRSGGRTVAVGIITRIISCQ